MRFLFKAQWPVKAGNAAIKEGHMPDTLRAILDELKPEAAYFLASEGMRTSLLVVNLDDASEIPALAEPWFHAFHAAVELVPVMTLDDLKKAGPAIEKAVKKFG
ncbi:MAG: DUF3303 family protein [Thermoguttaceae bacterium]